ncbi:MAG: dihydroneopterin aldolase [Gammaproteobacteria bacterium]|nr:dihydroneopterin aldolase [Gammaproteobacteria bacterium]
MDTVFIEDLIVEAVIGVHAWERKIKQKLVLNIEMSTDVAAAAATDKLEQALDYSAVADCLQEFIQASQYQLVETLIEHCAEKLMQTFNIPWIKIRLSKPGAVRSAKSVGLIIERGKHAANN